MQQVGWGIAGVGVREKFIALVGRIDCVENWTSLINLEW